MKYGKIMLFFLIALLFGITTRILQLGYAVETTTGFYKPQLENIGNGMLFAIFAAVIISATFAFTAHRSPKNPPERNKILAVFSIALAIVIFIHITNETYPAIIKAWQIYLLSLSGIASAAYFVLYAVRSFIFFPLPRELSVIPTIYLIIRIICDFTAISSLAFISDNILLLGAYCSSLWFMLSFTKLFNDADGERGFRQLLACGIMSSSLCIIQSVPHIIINIFTGYSYLHTSVNENVFILTMGLFILCFITTHFSKKNCCKE